MNQKIQKLKDRVSALEAQRSRLLSRIASSSMDDAGEVELMEREVSSLERDIASLERDIASLERQ